MLRWLFPLLFISCLSDQPGFVPLDREWSITDEFTSWEGNRILAVINEWESCLGYSRDKTRWIIRLEKENKHGVIGTIDIDMSTPADAPSAPTNTDDLAWISPQNRTIIVARNKVGRENIDALMRHVLGHRYGLAEHIDASVMQTVFSPSTATRIDVYTANRAKCTGPGFR